MISAPSVGIAFAPKPPPAAAVGSYRARKVRCAVAVAPAPAPAGTLYDVLGLRAGATVREIKAAYRRLARERHPDVAASAGADDFVRLHDAYATLSDPDSRARYDRDVVAVASMARGAHHRTMAAPPAPARAALVRPPPTPHLGDRPVLRNLEAIIGKMPPPTWAADEEGVTQIYTDSSGRSRTRRGGSQERR
uniref:J domain-containing protein n=1 Tax=Oryza rufipogon TaxID=4529 RepID=A0A0E0QM27_ORYRU